MSPTSSSDDEESILDYVWILISCVGYLIASAIHLTEAWIGFLIGWVWALLCILIGLILHSMKPRRVLVRELEVFFFVMFSLCWGLIFVRPAYGVPSAREIQIVQYYPFFSTGGLAVFSALTALLHRPWTLNYVQGLVPPRAIHHPLVLETAFITVWIFAASSAAACLLYLIPFMMKVQLQVKGEYDSRSGPQTGSNPLAIIFGIVVPIFAVVLPALVMYFWPPKVDPKQYLTQASQDPQLQELKGKGKGEGEASRETLTHSLVLTLPPSKPGWMGGEPAVEQKGINFPPPILPMPKSESPGLYPPVPPPLNWAVQPSAPVHFFTDSQNLAQSGLIPSAPAPTSSTFRYNNTGGPGDNQSYLNQLYQQQQPDGAQQQNAWLGNLLMGGGGGVPQGPVRVGDYQYGGGGSMSPPSLSPPGINGPMTIHHMHHVFVYNNHNRQPPEEEHVVQRRTRTVVE